MGGIQQKRQQFNVSFYLHCSDACVLLYLLYSIKKTSVTVESCIRSLHFWTSEGPKLPPLPGPPGLLYLLSFTGGVGVGVGKSRNSLNASQVAALKKQIS